MNTNHRFGRKIGRTQAKTALGLLRDVRGIIRSHPEVYNQLDVISEADNGCGTRGCVGGWCAVRMFGRSAAMNGRTLRAAADAMGLSLRQRDELFRAGAAGGRFQNGMPDAAGHAARGVAHIDRFIKRHYKQLRYTRLSRA